MQKKKFLLSILLAALLSPFMLEASLDSKQTSTQTISCSPRNATVNEFFISIPCAKNPDLGKSNPFSLPLDTSDQTVLMLYLSNEKS